MHDAYSAVRPTFALQSRRAGQRRRGFTLTELLVVIAIMAVLASLITVAVMAALNAARNAVISNEITGLDMALKAFKDKYGAYPPCDLSDPINNTKLQAFMAKAFPRHGYTFDTNTTTGIRVNLLKAGAIASTTANQPNPANALIFWLSGFTGNPVKPFPDYTASEVTTPIFDFDKARKVIVPNANGSGTTPTDCYIYKAPHSQDTPYVYFDASSYKPVKVTADLNKLPSYTFASDNIAAPYAADPVPPTATTFEYASPDSYQIIAAGQDGKFGSSTLPPATGLKFFPKGEAPSSITTMKSTEYTTEDNDNLTNFSAGKTLENSKP